MSDFAADDLSLPFHLHIFRSMSLHHWSELWLVAVDGGRTWQYTFAADGGYNKVQHLVLYLNYTFSPDGRYNKVKTLVSQAGEVWRTVLVVFGRNNGFTGWGRRSSARALEDKSRERQRCTVLRNDELCSTPQHLVAWGKD